ncbi:MAG: hypothetical protein WBB97_00950 [Dehalococcoidales bacterium]
MPIVGGVLEILAGFWMLFCAYVIGGLMALAPPEPWNFLWLLVPGLLGMLSVVGGICALWRRIWGLALAGAIATVPLFLVARFGLRWLDDYPYFEPTPPIFYLNLVSPLLLSIVIITLLILSKREFR